MNLAKLNPTNWIKRNYDQFILILVALGLLVISGFIINSAVGFQQIFAGITAQVFQNNNVPPLDMSALQQTTAALQNPARWELNENQGSIFVSVPYIAQGDTLINPGADGAVSLHPPVPNKWIIANGLNILDGNVLNEDPDGTGFTVLDDWKDVKGDGSDSINPNDKTVHPPYWTKLRLVQYIRQPFRLLFNAYDGDLKKPNDIDFQINTVDLNQPTQFVKIGDTIAGTKFKVIKFEYKQEVDPNTGSNTDVSELTVQNTETGDLVVLVFEKIANSPDSYALFRYLWNNTQFQVKKGKEFVLLPDTNLRYILTDITDTSATVQLPAGPQVQIPLLAQ
jgi:hypothetical protein